jgi:malate synthase
MGGMAAFIPSRRDPEVNAVAMAKVREDKQREAADGFDGSWVAHPDLVPLCKEVFDAVLGDRPNQLDRLRPDVHTTAADLLALADTPGAVTAAGLRNNVDVALRYTAAWLGGSGAVAIHNLMEDAATAEIARAQVWQWIRNGVALEDGAVVTAELVEGLIGEQLDVVRAELGEAAGRLDEAAGLLRELMLADGFTEFLTQPAYELVA